MFITIGFSWCHERRKVLLADGPKMCVTYVFYLEVSEDTIYIDLFSFFSTMQPYKCHFQKTFRAELNKKNRVLVKNRFLLTHKIFIFKKNFFFPNRNFLFWLQRVLFSQKNFDCQWPWIGCFLETVENIDLTQSEVKVKKLSRTFHIILFEVVLFSTTQLLPEDRIAEV